VFRSEFEHFIQHWRSAVDAGRVLAVAP
jgi:hypothetical protein